MNGCCRECVFFGVNFNKKNWCFHEDINKETDLFSVCPRFKLNVSDDFNSGFDEGYAEAMNKNVF